MLQHSIHTFTHSPPLSLSLFSFPSLAVFVTWTKEKETGDKHLGHNGHKIDPMSEMHMHEHRTLEEGRFQSRRRPGAHLRNLSGRWWWWYIYVGVVLLSGTLLSFSPSLTTITQTSTRDITAQKRENQNGRLSPPIQYPISDHKRVRRRCPLPRHSGTRHQRPRTLSVGRDGRHDHGDPLCREHLGSRYRQDV